MRIDFYIRYHTRFGEHLLVTGNLDALGCNNKEKALQMNYLNEEYWYASIDFNGEEPSMTYRYILKNQKGELLPEGEKHRTIKLDPGSGQLLLIDTWNNPAEYENAFYTAPFTGVLAKEIKMVQAQKPEFYTHTFQLKAPLLGHDECVCLLGGDPALRDWNENDPILMQKDRDWWTVHVDLSGAFFPLTYKYGIYNYKKKQFVRFEQGDNRILYLTGADESKTIVHDGFIYLPNNTWRGAGVALPVFSLRTKDSFGIGEFSDIRLLADWASEVGLKLIQLLPVNDTTATHTWKDSYPYAAISAFALNPVYINLAKVAGKEFASLLEPFGHKKKELNDLPQVDYEKVLHVKLNILRQLYEAQAGSFLQEEGYRKFFDTNAYWLIPYAAFCHFRDLYGTSEFLAWKTHSVYKEEEIKNLVAPQSKYYDEIAFWYFVQYHLHLQLKEAAEYTHKKGIVLKGDIPIGIYRNGCDAWMAPELYNLDRQAGAPPDDFAVKGQNWGFPTYNWKKMQEDHFEWWHRRFHQMSNYFDTFRIDHILGFFRIWSIPMDAVEGILGIFVPAVAMHPYEFEESGIPFDKDRFCKPFINDAIVGEIFAEKSDWIKNTFLQKKDNGLYDLKYEFNTQRKVAQHIACWEDSEENRKIKEGLFDLISNVILIEDPGSNGEQFHFRISMEDTSSYRWLPDHLKHNLYRLYIHYFYYRHDECWRKEALKKLPALKDSTSMLICGEDLGMVPHCVPDVMEMLGILSLEIQRMPKNPKTEFFHPADAPYLSVVTPSSHDMSTIRGWWEEDRVRTQRFFNTELGQNGPAPFFCEPWVNLSIVLQHLESPAMWAIFQLQDLLGISEKLRRENPHEERINEPSNPEHYWRYRVHLSMEQLLQEKEFNEDLRQQIIKRGR